MSSGFHYWDVWLLFFSESFLWGCFKIFLLLLCSVVLVQYARDEFLFYLSCFVLYISLDLQFHEPWTISRYHRFLLNTLTIYSQCRLDVYYTFSFYSLSFLIFIFSFPCSIYYILDNPLRLTFRFIHFL